MADPTITSITPAAGPTRGKNLIEIIGTGFRVPDLPSPTNGPAEPAPPGVRVLFDASVSPRTLVASDTRLFVEVPTSPLENVAPMFAEGSVDVVVQNIDEDGLLIPGEEVTSTDGYAYR